MNSLRWWHVAVMGIAVALATGLLFARPDATSQIGGLASLAAFVLAWLLLGRAATRSPRALAVYLPLMTLICAVGTYFETSLATMQCIAFPIIWSFVVSTRRAIIASIVFAATICLALYLGTGSLLAAVGIQLTSLIFALAMGAWFTSIYKQRDDRQRLLDELKAAQDDLAALNRDAGIAAERERLARELHDTIAQDLTGLVMLAQRARRELEQGTAGPTIAMIEESALAALAETRSLVAAGAPVGLASGGIRDALSRLSERFGRESGLSIEVEVGELADLDRNTEVVLLRIAQEALANVRKHSGAGSAAIVLSSEGSGVRLQVRDDGTGFDPETARDGFGLGGMRDRLALVGGTLNVSSSPAGTLLIATLPLAVHA